ncbi:MAG: hypothetical protein AAGI23_09985 [Bacteroidota bacterium]
MPPEYDDSEITDEEWLAALMTNSAFDFLHDEEEDIYTLEDGKPLSDTDGEDKE